MLSASPRRSGALALATTMLPVVESSALAIPRPTMSPIRAPGEVATKKAAMVTTRVTAPGTITARPPYRSVQPPTWGRRIMATPVMAAKSQPICAWRPPRARICSGSWVLSKYVTTCSSSVIATQRRSVCRGPIGSFLLLGVTSVDKYPLKRDHVQPDSVLEGHPPLVPHPDEAAPLVQEQRGFVAGGDPGDDRAVAARLGQGHQPVQDQATEPLAAPALADVHGVLHGVGVRRLRPVRRQRPERDHLVAVDGHDGRIVVGVARQPGALGRRPARLGVAGRGGLADRAVPDRRDRGVIARRRRADHWTTDRAGTAAPVSRSHSPSVMRARPSRRRTRSRGGWASAIRSRRWASARASLSRIATSVSSAYRLLSMLASVPHLSRSGKSIVLIHTIT